MPALRGFKRKVIDLKFSTNLLKNKKSCLAIYIHNKKLCGASQKESGGSRISLRYGKTKTQLLPKRVKREILYCFFLISAQLQTEYNRKHLVTKLRKLWKQICGGREGERSS